MKVKIFSDLSRTKINLSGKLKEPIFNELEKAVNDWLDEHPDITIHKIEQTVCPGSFFGSAEKLVITIFYERS